MVISVIVDGRACDAISCQRFRASARAQRVNLQARGLLRSPGDNLTPRHFLSLSFRTDTWREEFLIVTSFVFAQVFPRISI